MRVIELLFEYHFIPHQTHVSTAKQVPFHSNVSNCPKIEGRCRIPERLLLQLPPLKQKQSKNICSIARTNQTKTQSHQSHSFGWANVCGCFSRKIIQIFKILYNSRPMILNLKITPKITLRKLDYSNQRNLIKVESFGKIKLPKLQTSKIEQNSIQFSCVELQPDSQKCCSLSLDQIGTFYGLPQNISDFQDCSMIQMEWQKETLRGTANID